MQGAVLATWNIEGDAAFAGWKPKLPEGSGGVAKQILDAAADHARHRVWQLAGGLPSTPAPVSQTRARVEHALLAPLGSASLKPEQSALWTTQTQLCI